ncbi:MAG: DUF924 domain-containing protein [Rhizobiales bacterium]|nr:DUF924 domain-containing protein [Hyphomicrobiales bacterium]
MVFAPRRYRRCLPGPFRRSPRRRRRYRLVVRDAAAGAAAGIGFVLFLDQFPRNLFRDDGRAFAYDARARAAVRRLIAGGVERFAPIERVFLYLPFEHSEELADQDLSVSLYEALLAEVPEADKEDYQSFVGYAEKHRDLIRRFGRFPHRNADLGRASTPEEIEFLKDGRGY